MLVDARSRFQRGAARGCCLHNPGYEVYDAILTQHQHPLHRTKVLGAKGAGPLSGSHRPPTGMDRNLRGPDVLIVVHSTMFLGYI